MALSRSRRRKGVSALLGAITIATLAACSSSDEPNGSAAPDLGSSVEPVELEFWGWVPDAELLVDNWNEANPNIQVNFHRMTGDDGDKVEAAVEAGTAPDMVQLSTHSIPNYVVSGWVEDITEYTADAEPLFTEGSWNAVTVADRVYGIPQDSGPTAMMYREDILAEYGIDVPTTWDEYLQAARDLQAANPDMYIANISPTEIGQYMQEVMQAGGSWYDIQDDAWAVTMADDASMEVVERWQTLVDEGLVTTEQVWTAEYWSLVNSGAIATITYAAWFPLQLEVNAPDTSGLWRVAPMPSQNGDGLSADSGGAATIVLDGAENIAAAAEFAAWFSGAAENQETLITAGGIFPAAKAGLESPALLTANEFFGGQVINEVFAEAAANTATGWTDGPNYGAAQTAISDEFSTAINGSQTFAEALEAAQDSTVDNLVNTGLNVVTD